MRGLRVRGASTTRDERGQKMADNVIPGLDGDLPPNRGHLPDSLQASNGETVGYSSQRQGELAEPPAKHSKV